MHSTESGKWLMLRVSLIEASWKEGLWGPEGNCQSIVRHRITLAGIMPAKGLPLPLSLSLGILSSPLVIGFVHSRPLAPRFSAERNSISRLARSQRLAPLTNNATLCAPGVLPYCSRVTKYRSQPFHHHPFAPTPLCAAARCVVTALDTPRGLMEIEGRAECFSSVDRYPRTIGDETTLEDPRVENVRTG